MKKQRTKERELPEKRDACGADTDQLAELFSHQCMSSEQLIGSHEKFEPSTKPATDTADWDAWFDGEGVSEDFMKDRGENR